MGDWKDCYEETDGLPSDKCLCDGGLQLFCEDYDVISSHSSSALLVSPLLMIIVFVVLAVVALIITIVCCRKCRTKSGTTYRQAPTDQNTSTATTATGMFQTQSATPNTGTYGAPSPGGFTVHPPPQQQGSYPQHQTNYPQHQTNYPQQQGSYPQQQHQGFSPAHDLPPSYESAVGDRQPPFNPSYPAEKQPL